MNIEQVDNIITIVVGSLGVIAILFCIFHHLVIKPRQEERMRQLDLVFKTEVQRVFDKFRKDNDNHGKRTI